MNSLRTHSGFTLVEMLIAIAISAIVAAMAYQTFDGVSRNAERTRDVLIEINQLDKAWQIIGQDMRNVVPMDVQAMSSQVRFSASSLKTQGINNFQTVMIFARRGWVNPLGRLRSDLQQVNYRIADGQLWRDYLPERNMPLENIDFERASLHQLLLGDDAAARDRKKASAARPLVVTDFQVRFLSANNVKANGKSVLEGNDYANAWEPQWPPLNAGTATLMPIAVEMTIEIEGVGRSVRLFEIPQK